MLVVLLVGAAYWGLTLRSSVKSIKGDASTARAHLSASKSALSAGDFKAASKEASLARADVAAAQASAGSWAVQALGHVPYLGQAVSDVDHLIRAADSAVQADSLVVALYGSVTGKGPGTPLFAHHQVNQAELARAGTQVNQLADLLNSAEADLRQVKATLPGTHSLAQARDSAMALLVPLNSSIERLQTLWPHLPGALGFDGPRNYLLAVENPAELLDGGGAALAAAVIHFDHGKMSVPVKGSVSSDLFWNNPPVVWTHVSGPRYFRTPRMPASFAWAGEHPDFSLGAVEMLRAWKAHTGLLPDGIVVVDPVALAAMLQVTGPIKTPVYGNIDSSNLVQRLLIDSYNDYGRNRDARHTINDLLMGAMLSRLTGGHGLLDMVKHLSATAPGRHFRMYFFDKTLQSAVVSVGWDGTMTRTTGDLIDVFTIDQNANKVSVFQRRNTSETVTLQADGGATVTRVVTVTNGAPTQGFNPSDRIGLTTHWAYNHVDIFLPKTATDVVTSSNLHGTNPSLMRDVNGWWIQRVSAWLKPAQSIVITVRYRLPAGTFGTGSQLRYFFVAEPTPMILTPRLELTVQPPAGFHAVLADGWVACGVSACLSAAVDKTVQNALVVAR